MKRSRTALLAEGFSFCRRSRGRPKKQHSRRPSAKGSEVASCLQAMLLPSRTAVRSVSSGAAGQELGELVAKGRAGGRKLRVAQGGKSVCWHKRRRSGSKGAVHTGRGRGSRAQRARSHCCGLPASSELLWALDSSSLSRGFTFYPILRGA